MLGGSVGNPAHVHYLSRYAPSPAYSYLLASLGSYANYWLLIMYGLQD